MAIQGWPGQAPYPEKTGHNPGPWPHFPGIKQPGHKNPENNGNEQGHDKAEFSVFTLAQRGGGHLIISFVNPV
jgi:hypothetical protein